MSVLELAITLGIIMILCASGIWVDTTLYFSALQNLASTEVSITHEELQFLKKSFDER
ncbi:MAG: hypothetical protein V4519_02475 [Patescibacteria group bacterium]